VLFRIRNAGVTNVQWCFSGVTGDPVQSAATAITTAAVDTTAAANIILSLTLGTATDYAVLLSHSIKLYPN
jgi:hypothetical protein